jgi:hypothetical protein
MNFKTKIFNLFSPYDHTADINKNSEHKGTNQRYNEVVGGYIDEELLKKIDNLVENNLLPDVAYERFIPYLEQRLGVSVIMGNTMEWRRRVLAHILHWYQIRGTIKAYTLMLSMLGFESIEIIEDMHTNSLDSVLTFDDPDRVFDMSKCNRCIFYDIKFKGTIQITPELNKAIDSIIKFNEPINARRRTIRYNDKPLITKIISVWIDDNGDLIYSNDYDPELILELSPAGDLIVKGPNAEYYSLDEQGNLVYIYG